MLATKIAAFSFLSVASFGLVCLFWSGIVFGARDLSEGCSHWFPKFLICFIAAKIAVMVLIVWLAFGFSMWGEIWVEVAGPANVPHWAVVLFSGKR